MSTLHFRMTAAWFTLGVLALLAMLATEVRAHAPAVDPAATKIGGRPLPRQYVVTDTATPARLSISTLISDWNVAPAVAEARFDFMRPPGVKRIEFIRQDVTRGFGR
jgi:Predicted periplasmic protein (DUF2092)